MNYSTLDTSTGLKPEIKEFQDLISKYNHEILKKDYDVMIHVKIQSALKEFNEKQKVAELCGKKIESFYEMMDFYAEHHKCIQAELKRAGYPSYSYFSTYKKTTVTFYDLCKHCNCNINYKSLEALFSTVCYNIFENMRNDESIYGIPLLDKKNPYKPYNLTTIIGKRITPADVISKSAIKKILEIGFTKTFKGESYVTSKEIRHLLMLVATKTSVRKIVNAYFLMHISTVHNIDISENSSSNNKISRHISWCIHESDRYCALLKQPCNSSVNCALYRGVTYKG